MEDLRKVFQVLKFIWDLYKIYQQKFGRNAMAKYWSNLKGSTKEAMSSSFLERLVYSLLSAERQQKYNS